MFKMKLNCDLGEYAITDTHSPDANIMPYIDMANIACGGHAGCTQTMIASVKLAKQHGVLVGAHPSYPDRDNFGRVSMCLEASKIVDLLQNQLQQLETICQQLEYPLSYVKPHGGLYNDMMRDTKVFTAICKGLQQFNSSLPLMIQAIPDRQQYIEIADQYNITLWHEAFADRQYLANGLLMPRSKDGAVFHSLDKVLRHCRQLIIHNEVQASNGQIIAVHADSLCVHGDSELALAMVASIRELLNELHE